MDFRLRDFAYPLGILRLRRSLEATQWWSEARLSAWQDERLCALVRHAAAQVPYYARVLGEAGVDPAAFRGTADLARLPLLSKDLVREHEAALHARHAWRYGPRPSLTSGSTGTALRFLLDRPTNVLEFATLWRQFNWAGYRFGDTFCDLRGRVVHAADGVVWDPRLRSLNLSSFELTRERARVYAARIRAARPALVRGYPSSISVLARWMLEDGLDVPPPRAVLTSSETLLEADREIIGRAFGAPVLDYYGQMERVAFIGMCAEGRYHVVPEYGVVEVLDDHDRPVAPGVEGQLVATGLHHRAMPFIRYQTRDLVVLGRESCPCGRAYATVERITGRLEDLVITPDGRHVGRLDAAFKYSQGIRLAQIVQDSAEAITVRIVRAPSYSEADSRTLLRELRARLGEAIHIDLVFVDAIATTAAGKLQFVVSRVGARGSETLRR